MLLAVTRPSSSRPEGKGAGGRRPPSGSLGASGGEGPGPGSVLADSAPVRHALAVGGFLVGVVVGKERGTASIHTTLPPLVESTKRIPRIYLNSTDYGPQVLRAHVQGNYYRFFRLYQAAPHMSAFLMDFLLLYVYIVLHRARPPGARVSVCVGAHTRRADVHLSVDCLTHIAPQPTHPNTAAPAAAPSRPPWPPTGPSP